MDSDRLRIDWQNLQPLLRKKRQDATDGPDLEDFTAPEFAQ